MKVTTKRILGLVLALMMIFALAACNNDADTTSSPSKSPTATPSDTPNDTDGPVDPDAAFNEFMQPYDETVEITTARVWASWMTLADGDDENNNWYTRAYLEHLNIKTTCIWTADGWGEPLDTKWNTSLAANDLPDVTKVYTSLAIRAMEANQIMEITDEMYETWLSDYVKDIYAYDPVAIDAWTIDGKLMGLADTVRGLGASRYFWWVRDDWMAQTNSSMPTNLNEVVDLARTFMSTPDLNEASSSMYGISIDKNLGLFTNLLPVFGVTSVGWYPVEDGTLSHYRIQPGVQDAIQFLADLYAEGILPEEFAQMDANEQVVADRINGKYGIWLEGTNYVATPKFTDWYEMNPDDHTVSYTLLTDFDGNLPKMWVSSSYGDVILISAKCQNPDAVFKLLNLGSDIVSATRKPEWITDRSYDTTPGSFNFWQRICGLSDPRSNNPHIIADAFDARDPSTLTTLDQVETYNQMVTWVEQGFDDEDWANDIYRYLLNKNGSTVMIQYDLNMTGQYHEFTPFWSGETPAMQENGSAWNSKFLELVTLGIMNNTAEASFNEFVNYFYANGGQQAIDEANAWYDTHK